MVTRYSAHHWLDFEGGLREARRVATPGSPRHLHGCLHAGRALLDTHLQSLELLRDTSHVRNYTLAEWSDALARAGFALKSVPHLAAASGIRKLDRAHAHAGGFRGGDPGPAGGAPDEVRKHFAITADGSFTIDTMMLETIAG